MMRRLLPALLILFTMGAGAARAEQFFYTYVGLCGTAGLTGVEHDYWDKASNLQRSKSENGVYFAGGPVLSVVADNFIGEFSTQFMRNVPSASNLYITATGKYAFKLTKSFFLAPGLGMYFETPLSDEAYNGGGGFAGVLGAGFQIGDDIRICLDGSFRYGYVWFEERGTRMSYGAQISVLYKVGRL